MKIAVTKTMPAAPDGVHTQRYRAGETYEMPDELGTVFVRERWGKAVKDEPPKEKEAEKQNEDDRTGGEANKGGKGPNENKQA